MNNWSDPGPADDYTYGDAASGSEIPEYHGRELVEVTIAEAHDGVALRCVVSPEERDMHQRDGTLVLDHGELHLAVAQEQVRDTLDQERSR